MSIFKIKENKALESKLNKVAWVLSVIILLVVGGMRQIKIDIGRELSFLPPFHSAVNVLTAVILIYAFIKIKNGDLKRHQRAMKLAMFTSLVFLTSYVAYHITSSEVKFGGEGTIRTVYFVLLISHVVLAAVIFPFILFTFIRGYTGSYLRHKKMARWVFPIWLYVAISGPICYLLLKPYY